MKWLVLTGLVLCCVVMSPDTAAAQQCEVLVDGASNSCGQFCLIPSRVHDISLRIAAPCLPEGVAYCASHGLVIYSPDGAQWTFTQPGTLPAWDGLWNWAFMKMYHKIAGSGEFILVDAPVGPGSDSVAVGYAGGVFAPEFGLWSGFNEPVWTIRIQTRLEDRGKHICIDSVASATLPVPGFVWKWLPATGSAPDVIPVWQGPYCFEIQSVEDSCPWACGDVNGVGGVTMGDIMNLISYLYQGGSLAEPCTADMDGYAGITNNDLITLLDYLFVAGGGSLDCDGFVGTVFPVSDDMIELRNTTVLPGSGVDTVQVWLNLDAEEAYGLTLTFSFESSDPLHAVTLDEIIKYYDKSNGSAATGNRDDKGLLAYHSWTDTVPHHVADLVFTVSPPPLDTVHILIDTTDYPPGHTTVLSRFSTGGPTIRARGVRPQIKFYADGASSPIGDAHLETIGDTLVVGNIDSTGKNGVRVPGTGSTTGMDVKFTNLDLSVAHRSVSFDLSGRTESRAGLQRLSGVGVYQDTGGTIQVLADYTLIGDPNVRVKAYNGTVIAGEADIVGGGIVAVGQDMGYGLPQIVGVQFRAQGDPTFIVEFSVPLAFKLTEGPTLYGNILHLVSTDATEAIVNFDQIDITGMNLVSFGLYDIDRTICCVGMRGNVDCSPDDFVTMGDLTVLIDNLFISLTPLCCEEEGEVDGEDPITMGDLTRMIDYLFITLTPLPACP